MSKDTKNWVGTTVGKLTVVSKLVDSTKQIERIYTCKCECGKSVTRNEDQLQRKRRTTCGSCNKKKSFIDLTGKSFGDLKVIGVAESRSRTTYFNCQCKCGTKLEAKSSDLRSGKRSNCGCNKGLLKDQSGRIKDLTGQEINGLKVLSFSHSNKVSYWNCKCLTCSEEKVLSSDQIRLNKSCGCLMTKVVGKKLEAYQDKTEPVKEKYGVLKVIQKVKDSTKSKERVYKCQCQCGHKWQKSEFNLKRSKNKYCPNCKAEYSFKDLTGKVFDKLTVLNFLEDKNNRKWFNCVCECGAFCTKDSGSLISQRYMSCGCHTPESKPFGVIYYLYQGDTIIYVGQTKWPEKRFLEHKINPYARVKEFLMSGQDFEPKVVLENIPSEYLDKVEKKLIEELSEKQPLLNVTYNTEKHDYTKLLKNTKPLLRTEKYQVELVNLNNSSNRKYLSKRREYLLEQGVNPVFVFPDTYKNKKQIIESRINNLQGKSTRIFARKCVVREVNTTEAINFQKENHLQGAVGSAVKLGLYFDDNLVALMTFGKFRKNMGRTATEGGYELLRFCNKLNTQVIGGASKLLKYFEKKYSPKHIISYCDLCWSSGDVYNKLGFTKVRQSQPNYFYYGKDLKRKNRFNFRKSELVKQGFDKQRTEKQIVLEDMGYNITYDCGTYLFQKIY